MGNDSNQVFRKVCPDDEFEIVELINGTEINFPLALKSTAGLSQHLYIGPREQGELKLIRPQQVVGPIEIDGPRRSGLCRGHYRIQCVDEFLRVGVA